ncbi:MAG: hypothetical protein Q8P44_09670, partial [Dehalococcoidia bacterium]|nr:hypothetical protein [Dehalococcoidia bacterium]
KSSIIKFPSNKQESFGQHNSVVSHKWPYNLCHSGLDPESSLLLWIPAKAGMTPMAPQIVKRY